MYLDALKDYRDRVCGNKLQLASFPGDKLNKLEAKLHLIEPYLDDGEMISEEFFFVLSPLA